MSETRMSEWRRLCFQAVYELEPERRMAILIELGRILSRDVHNFGPLQVDVGQTAVKRDGMLVSLTRLEFQLLRHFIERAGSPVSRDELLRSVWGYNSGALTRTVDMHVHTLRQKLELDAKRPELIVTVPRVGYKFVALADSERQGSSSSIVQSGP